MLVLSVVLATAGVLVVAGAAILHAVESAHAAGVERDLRTRTRLVARQLWPRLSPPPGESAGLDAIVRDEARAAGVRLTIIAADGTVLADSERDAASMENHADRPEVRQARATGEGFAVHDSRTLGLPMLYAAIGGPEPASPIVRAALPLRAVEDALSPTRRALALAGFGILAVVSLATLGVARALTRPLRAYEAAAARFAEGDLSRRLPVARWRELAPLGEALNQVAAQLGERLETITRQASERQAILAGMSEGVLAVDGEARVISLNDAAANMLGIASDRAAGRPMLEVTRHAGLDDLMRGVLETGAPAEVAMTFGYAADRHVQARCAVLRLPGAAAHGAVAVLTDVTRLRQLEAVRSDFVANVSHELRTPVTAILGFVETLRDGALEEPERATRFLGIVARQAERLSAIIDDLLTLSRLEQAAGTAELPRRASPIAPILESAAQACEQDAAARRVPLRIACPESLQAVVNAPLLEQAVVNLITNAIKHSVEGSPVDVAAVREGECLRLTVADRGCGIAAEHLPRLFERFYRVDRARSRQEGGTGLGLAIVKHIARVHGGGVGVTSAPGEGSCFTLTLPAG